MGARDASLTDVMDGQLAENRWVRAVETRPADSESGYVFHHANTSLFQLEDNERRGGLSSSASERERTCIRRMPVRLMRPDDQIHFSMHLFPIGREVVDARIQIGVWLYPEE